MGDSPLTIRSCRRSKSRHKDSVMSVPEQTIDSIPKASASALHFLRSLDNCDFENMEFCDRLTTVSNNNKEIGSFSISATSPCNGFGNSFLVKASSIGKIDNMRCGTKIVAHVSRNMLETIEHQQHDFVFLKGEESLKRDTEIIKQPNGGCLIRRTVSRGQDVETTSRFIDQKNATGLISEAADLILQRLLVLKGVPSDFVVISLDTNGNIGFAKYEELKEIGRTVTTTTVGISRTILSWRDERLSWHSRYTSTGRLTYRHQIGSSVSMQLSTGDGQIESSEDSRINVSSSACDKVNCQPDLFSSTSEKTRAPVLASTMYLKQHPELNSVTNDFLQLLFIHKPTSVPLFAANYFSLASETESAETTTVTTT